jgi:hypothetical protein
MRRALLAILLSGCGAWVYTPTLVLDGFPQEPSRETFARLVEVARAAGYEPLDVDPVRGEFRVHARYRVDSSDPPATFETQCFRRGWVQVRIAGSRVSPRGDEQRLPSELRDEYQAFVLALGAVRAP